MADYFETALAGLRAIRFGLMRNTANENENMSILVSQQPEIRYGTLTSLKMLPVDVTDASTAAAVSELPGAALKLVIHGIDFYFVTACVVTFHEETTAGNVVHKQACLANTAYQWRPCAKTKLWTVNKRLMVLTSAASVGNIKAYYHYEA